MSSGAFGRNNHGTAEDFKKSQDGQKRRESHRIHGSQSWEKQSIDTFIKSVNEHLVTAYYVSSPLLSIGVATMNKM